MGALTRTNQQTITQRNGSHGYVLFVGILWIAIREHDEVTRKYFENRVENVL